MPQKVKAIPFLHTRAHRTDARLTQASHPCDETGATFHLLSFFLPSFSGGPSLDNLLSERYLARRLEVAASARFCA